MDGFSISVVASSILYLSIFHPLSNINNGVACGRAIRSYCTGISHMAGIRFYP
jgi:hypothetical protein